MHIFKSILNIALIHIIIKISIYLIDIEAFAINKFGIYRSLFLLVMIIFSIYKLKEEQRNRPFSQIFLFVFGTFIIAAFMGCLIDILIFSVFKDGDIIDIITDNEYKGYLDELDYMDATGDVDRDEIRDMIIANSSPWGLFKSFLIGIPFSIIISTIISLFFYPSRSE